MPHLPLRSTLCLLPMLAASAGIASSGEAVTYANGPIELAAELLLPAETDPPVAGAVVIQGSGTSDRTNAWSREVADALREMGLAVLLTDKRGSGLSGGDWRTAAFGDLAGDALVGARYLAGRPEVDARRVGVVGLSQGGRVAPIVGAIYPREIAFVVSLSGSAVGFAEQSFFEMANTARQAGLDETGVAGVVELNRQAARYLATGDWESYAAERRRGLESSWAEVTEGFPATRDDPTWRFLSRAVRFDPMLYWLMVRQPVLAAYGAHDERDNVPVAESVRRLERAFALSGHRDHEIVVLDDAGHGLRDPSTGKLHPELLARLEASFASWLAADDD